MKIYGGYARMTNKWAEALNARGGYNVEAAYIVVAQRKADVAPLLTDRGVSQVLADVVAAAVKLYRLPTTWVPLREMLEAGVASADEVGVYVFQRFAVGGDPIVRVEPDGALAVVGHFDSDSSHGALGTIVVPVA